MVSRLRLAERRGSTFAMPLSPRLGVMVFEAITNRLASAMPNFDRCVSFSPSIISQWLGAVKDVLILVRGKPGPSSGLSSPLNGIVRL